MSWRPFIGDRCCSVQRSFAGSQSNKRTYRIERSSIWCCVAHWKDGQRSQQRSNRSATKMPYRRQQECQADTLSWLSIPTNDHLRPTRAFHSLALPPGFNIVLISVHHYRGARPTPAIHRMPTFELLVVRGCVHGVDHRYEASIQSFDQDLTKLQVVSD